VNFKEAESYLLSLGNEVSTMKLGLENIRRLLAAVGNPQNNYLKVQIAGTNGKGSVCAFLEAICLNAGIRIGLTTSPHLISITERVRINGSNISEDDFARLASRVRETSERLVERGDLETVPTYFEQVTAVALLAFAEAKVELAILETGLGGRLDATTAAKSELIGITRIDYDHQVMLGETLTAIAGEKAAIINDRRQAVIVGEQPSEAMQVFMDRCVDVGVEPRLAKDVGVDRIDDKLTFTTALDSYHVNGLGLFGLHQIENAKVAILLAEALRNDFPVTAEDIAAGLEMARHPGRLEVNKNFIFDGAHNVGGATALRQFLDEFVPEPVTLIYGTMADKDVAEVTRVLFPKAASIVLTRPENSRAVPAGELLDFVPDSFPNARVFITDSVGGALAKAKEITPKGGRILVTGSLYLVGEAKKILNN
jgi:dihydrofolate synthase/folylpolyglutamate synthase